MFEKGGLFEIMKGVFFDYVIREKEKKRARGKKKGERENNCEGEFCLRLIIIVSTEFHVSVHASFSLTKRMNE